MAMMRTSLGPPRCPRRCRHRPRSPRGCAPVRGLRPPPPAGTRWRHRSPELRIGRQQAADGGDHVRRHRCPGRGHPGHRRQWPPVPGQHPHQRWRAEQLGHAEALDGIVQASRVGLRRPRRVHVRDHRGQPQRRVEQRERWEGRQVHPTRFHAEGTAQQLDLADEVAVAVDDALGHAGGAAGEQDRRHVLAIGVGQHRPSAGASALQRGQRGAAPAEAAADRHQPGGRRRPAQHQPRHMRQRNADESLRLRLVQALLQRAPVDARIDQHRHCAQLEQREHQQEELRRRPHHHHRAHATADPVAGQAGGHGITAGVQLTVIEGDIVGGHAVAGAAAAGAADGDLVGAFTRQFRQPCGDIAGSVHPFIVAAYGISCAAATSWKIRSLVPDSDCRPRRLAHATSLHDLRRLLHPVPRGLPLDGIGRGHPGGVPHQLTEVLDPHRLCMRGTHSKPVRCVALDAQIGVFTLHHPPQSAQRVP